MDASEVMAALLESAWISARVAAILSLVLTFVAVVGIHVRAHAGKASAVPPRVRPPGSAPRLAAMAAVVVVGAFATARTPGQVEWFPAPVQAIAAAAAALSCLSGTMIAVWAALSLGANFAVGATVRGDARASLVTSGPFTLVRHPMYTALGLLFAGAALAWGSLLGFALVGCAYPWTARWRADLEEQALAAAWPEEWRTYAARTPRFLPRM